MNATQQHARFDRWLHDHAAILHHVVNGFAGGEERKDLMQEVLLALWKAIPAFRNDAQPSTFVYRVSHNAALTWTRTQRNYRARLERFQAEPAAETTAPPPDAGEQELLERLYGGIRDLPPLDRSLALLFLDGLTYAEMAAIHGLTESAVGVRLHRLKQSLADAMKGSAHGPR